MASVRLLLNTHCFMLFILLLHYSISSLCCPHDQKQALLQFKDSLMVVNGSSSNMGLTGFSSWSSSSDCCQWGGVTCSSNSTTPQVIDLYLSNVIGSVSSHVLTPLFFLRSLEYLDLSSNNIEGEIPGSGLANLTQLVELVLCENSFVGVIPPQLFYLRQLRVLDLSWNSLHGEIPTDITNLTNLQYLRLSFNNFSGVIPAQLSYLKKLEVLNLRRNSFHGEIPLEMGNLTSLLELYLSENNLWGVIPQSLRKLDNLTFLWLENNKLSSEITWLLDLPHIDSLYLGGNNLSWDMSIVPKTIPPIQSLSFPSSNLEGEIPFWFSNLNLYFLDLSGNQLIGSIPPGLFRSKILVYFDVSFNALSGNLPNNISEALHLVWLNVASNKFSGQVPAVFPPLIRVLQLCNNEFSGVIPQNLIDLENLNYLDLHNNNITGEVPQFHSQNSLYFLNLANNSLKGIIPESLFSLENIQVLDLSCNQISGIIPETLGKLNGMIDNPDSLATILTSGTVVLILPAEVQLPNMEVFWKKFKQSLHNISIYTYFDLSNNRLSGEIPDGIGALKSLKLLNVSHNNLSGRIPDTIGDLRDMESLDLSHNDLSGEIPRSFGKLLQLTNLDLSNNKLTGEIPNGPQMDTMNDPNSYANNSGLCGMQISESCDKANKPNTTKEDDESDKIWFSWELAGIGYFFGFVTVVVTLYVSGYFIIAPKRSLRQQVRFRNY